MPDIRSRVERALDSVREYIRADGGDVVVHQVTPEGVVQLELTGACSSCSMSHMTMKAGVEQAILKAVPEVVAVTTV